MYRQLNYHDPRKGLYGDCYRTCVANYLGMHPSEVPGPTENGEVKSIVRSWLQDRGLTTFFISFDASLVDGEPWVHWVERVKFQKSPYILSGRNKKHSANHSCLYHRGELLHDPSGGDGLHYPIIDEDDGAAIWTMELIVHLPVIGGDS